MTDNFMSISEFVTRYKTEKNQNVTNNEWIKTMWYIPHTCTVECYSAVKCLDICDDMNEFGRDFQYRETIT